MKQVPVLLVDAFTTTPGKGNRAGVVLDASGLTEPEMQAVAALVGVSETAFMIPAPDGAGYELEVRYFTPAAEVPICGHATIASHFVRSRRIGLDNGTVTVKTGAGVLPVDIVTEGKNRKIIMTQGRVSLSPPYGEEDRELILSALGLSERDLAEGLPVTEASTGHSKVMVPIRSVETLDALEPNMDVLAGVSKRIGCNGFFVFAFNGEGDPCLTSGRMFAPAIGVDEDPVTGNGNGPCGAYLSSHGVLPDVPLHAYLGRQGVAMGKEGVIEVTVQRKDGAPVLIQVGGTAVEAGAMTVELQMDDSGHILARAVS
ncbi:PhzF family isomerase [Pseudodesulfovibrio cashew]|uniref:PhzF family isomerase n=1 Tax=Pseudodesulfovibrio cashew TaxID=2678688 RepID=A0A6I6JG10_9BACT|nr:PhzF family isomerase [Pseudodesulfovibrio cashew]QGY41776.1 PhzF family isomerase [Pseudodesulfovibrio cashew]